MESTETTDNIIFAYTRQDAIDDGVFIDITKTAEEAMIRFPTCISSNLYHTYINPDPMPENQDEKGRLWDLLTVFYYTAKSAKDSFMKFTVKFSGKNVEVWAVCEPASPTDPQPCINIFLPEDR